MQLGVAVLLILFIGAITSIISKKFKIAYTKLLVIVGVLISIASHALGTPREFTGELIISVVLPPLIFQAALTMNYAVFKKVQRTVILLAVVSVAISAIVCSLIVASFTSLPPIAALAFGVMIAPTDAASVQGHNRGGYARSDTALTTGSNACSVVLREQGATVTE